MKHFFLIFATALLSVHAAGAAGGPDPARFSRPEPADQIATWWHWMDGSLTKDGLTKDLEAMKAQGISNATVLNIYRMIGVQNTLAIPFDSPEWYDMFRHAVEKADSLGIEIGAANCDGWSESGGPWITPETSMKMYTWRKTYAKGNGREQTIRLAQPFGKERFYRDVAVVAWRSDAPNSFVAASPKASCNGSYPLETLIKSHKYHDETRHIDLYDDFPAEILIDGNPETALTLAKDDRDVRFEFSKPFTADELHIYILVSAANFPIPVTVSVSDDGKDYRTAGTVWPKSANSLQKLRFPEATGRYWKVTVNDEFSPTTLAEIALLRHGERGLYDTVAPETVPSADKVIDLTDRMSADGTLKWNVPRGDWTIIRFGYTSNGKFNHPASPQGVGLECDKMDTTALNIHFAAFPQKLIEAAGPYTGKTFTYLLVDSWECGQQNWTAAFPEEFRKRRGYDLTPYIPVLCGEQVGGAEISAAFRHDFDRTRGELVLDYYFKHLSDLCHRNGLKLYSEGIYGGNGMPPVDVLKSYEYSDVPMTEFWAQSSEYREWPIVNEPGNYGNHAIPYHVSLLYDKPVIGCEAYTGMALYSDSPIDLKLFGDRAYCEGVNKMILHSYVHQPTDMRPGVTLGIYGQTFNRNNTWFNWADGFFGEQARIQYMLQQGDRRADALVYIGDALPNVEMSESEIERTLPANIKFQYINQEVLLGRLSVRDGLIWLDGRVPFKFLMLRGDRMHVETARRIEQLVRDGAVVYGPRPSGTLSLAGLERNNAELREIAGRVWGDSMGDSGVREYGKGKVISSLRALKRNYTPELSVRGANIDDILYIHKSLGDTDWYYIISKDNLNTVNIEAVFDLDGRYPEIWDPMDGSVRNCALFTDGVGYTSVPLTLRPKQGVFVVLRKGEKLHVSAIETPDGRSLYPVQDNDWSEEFPAVYQGEDGEFYLEQLAGGSYYVAFSNCTNTRVKVEEAGRVVLDGIEGTMTFEDEPLLGTLPIGGFKDFTKSLNPLIKYYSGTVTYRLEAVLPEDFLNGDRRIRISIPAFGSTASLEINGHRLETIWDPSFMADITEYVRKGANELKIVVTNPWRNRLTGDKAGIPSSQKLWTTSPLQQKHIPPQQIIHEYTKLYPAGISRPITIYAEEKTLL